MFEGNQKSVHELLAKVLVNQTARVKVGPSTYKQRTYFLLFHNSDLLVLTVRFCTNRDKVVIDGFGQLRQETKDLFLQLCKAHFQIRHTSWIRTILRTFLEFAFSTAKAPEEKKAFNRFDSVQGQEVYSLEDLKNLSLTLPSNELLR